MAERFLICLAAVLEQETGYKSRPEGPYLRHADGSTRIPTKADGRAFDDHPRDPGGRTCMGLTQREYDAWRRSMGLAARDVWQIEDRELVAIYRRQYWDACRAGELPPGLDCAVFDAAVNCGVGMGARFLQRALGVRDDGHIGQVTLAEAQACDVGDTVAKLLDARRRYHRASRNFDTFGAGWLARCDQVEEVCLTMTTRVPSAPVLVDGEATQALGMQRALPPPPADTVAETNTAKVQAVQVGGGGALTLDQSLTLFERVQSVGLLEAINRSPATLFLIAFGLVVMSGGLWQLRDRARKLILGV